MSGYFVYDLIYGIIKKYNANDMHFHHVVSLVFVAWPLFSGYNGAEAVEAIIQAEITNPFINGTEIFPMYGDGYPKQTMFCQFAFLFTFIVVRVFWSTNSLRLLQLSDSSLAFKFVPTFIWALSMKWVWMMVNNGIKIAYEVNGSFSGTLTSRATQKIQRWPGLTKSRSQRESFICLTWW